MAVEVIYGGALTADGELVSSSATYATARSGGGTVQQFTPSDGLANTGQKKAGVTYSCFETFLEFDLSSITGLVQGAYVHLYNQATSGGVTRRLEVREHDFGASLTTGDWVAGASLSGLDFLADIPGVQSAPAHLGGLRGGSPTLRTRCGGASPLRCVVTTDRVRSGATPTGDEYNVLSSPSVAGTEQDPALIVRTIPPHTHVGVGAASVVLSDGSCVYLESDGAVTSGQSRPALTLYRWDGTSAVSLGTVTTGVDMPNSYAPITLTCDSSDNVYVVWARHTDGLTVRGRCWAKTGASTWTARTELSGQLPAYVSASCTYTTTVTGVWVPTAGAGVILALVDRCPHTGVAGQRASVVLSAAALLAGAGSMVVASVADPPLPPSATSAELIPYQSGVGTGVDMVVLSDGSVAVAGYTSASAASATVCTVTASGTVSVLSGGTAVVGDVSRDPDSKLRVLSVGGGRYAVVCGDGTVTFRGGTVGCGTVALSVASLPALAGTAAWDAAYDPASRRVVVWYVDAAAPRTIRRTSVDASTYLPVGDETTVTMAAGPVGCTVLSIRAPRGPVDERRVRLSLATLAGGTYGTSYVDDAGMNLAPTAPVLGERGNYDAAVAGVFPWTFTDPNPADSQSAYRVQVDNASTLVNVVDTGKTVSAVGSHTVAGGTLSNTVAYRWRVKTWDAADVEGAWSDYGTFACSVAGTVTITSPAVDDVGVETADVPVSWTFSAGSGATQVSRRVLVTRLSDSHTMVDTGMVADTTTTYTVVGLATGVRYSVTVTVTDSNSVVSNAAVRYVTPSYGEPNRPAISVTPVADGGYVLVSVTNPTPTGSRPPASRNDLYRRVASRSAAWFLLGTVPVNGECRDYTCPGGVDVDYFVRTV